MGGTSTGGKTIEAEARILKAMPARMAVARCATEQAPQTGFWKILQKAGQSLSWQKGPQQAGQLSRMDLLRLMQESLSNNQLVLNQSDQNLLVDALLRLGDTNNNGVIDFKELE